MARPLSLGEFFTSDFQDMTPRARQFQRLRGLHDDAVGGGTVRVAVQNLLGNGHRLGGISAQRHLGLGDLRRGAGAAHHFFEKAACRAPAFLELRVAQRLAAFEKARLLFQHLVEQRDGVIEVFPLRGFVGLGEQDAARRAKFR